MSAIDSDNPEHLHENVQIAWDATSLSRFMTCPRKYQLSILQGWTTRRRSIYLDFGSAYHKSLEIYDKARADGHSQQVALRAAVRVALSADLENEDRSHNRFTLVRSVVWYAIQYQHDSMKTLTLADGTHAVELSFLMHLPLKNPWGDPYLLCGHIDGLVRNNGKVYILERKTTGSILNDRYWSQFSPNVQISTYATASKVILADPDQSIWVVIDACQTAVNFSRYARHYIHRDSSQLEEFLTEVCYYIKIAENLALDNYWPKNESACRMCEFKQVCSKPQSLRQSVLEAEYMQRPRWEPLRNR